MLDVLFLLCLSSDNFEIREYGNEYLKSRGTRVVEVIRQGKMSKDTEVRSRCSSLYDRISKDLADEFILFYGRLPMLDSFWYDASKRTYSREFNEEMYSRYSPLITKCLANPNLKRIDNEDIWHAYYEATRLMIEDIYSRDDKDEIDNLLENLNELYRRDIVFYGGLDKVPTCRRR